jgi:glutamate-ammonia-ligase adenylyltransferase
MSDTLLSPTGTAPSGAATPASSGPARRTPDAAHSRFVQRVRRRHGAELGRLPAGRPDAAAIEALVSALQAEGRDLAAALRVARQLVLERLAVLDTEAGLPLAGVTATMTSLAEVALERALAAARDEADARFGAALRADGTPCELWIVGMGKLGAAELNVSSDIDLIYVHEEEGTTAGAAGRAGVSFGEYFAFVARRLQALVGDVTEDGFVFRMDLALRPNGQSGPPAVSLAMLEEYFQVQGREWERFAWLKSRVVAPRAAVASGRAQALKALVTPFVYRRYLDYGVFEGLRALHAKIREEAQRRAMGRPERGNDVKLSRGGIREIEFVVQLMLVVRGGQYPEIRTRSTLKGLERLAAAGLMRREVAERLAAGYVLLRRIEHRIQYLDDQQTHVVPTADADLAWIAATLGFACRGDACELLERLGDVREFVAAEFDALLREGRDGGAPAAEGEARGGCRRCGPAAPTLEAEALLERLPPALAERVQAFCRHPRVLALKDASRQRLAQLVRRAAAAVEEGACDEAAAVRFVDWCEPLLRRESYLALLVERPAVQLRLLRLLGLARWPMQMLMRHPGVIDELADERLLAQGFDATAYVSTLEERRAGWQRSDEAGEETLLDTLRRAHQAEVFRILVRDVEGVLTVEQVADELSLLADTTLDVAMRWAWALFRERERAKAARRIAPSNAPAAPDAEPAFVPPSAPRLAVLAYGKLGGKELGYRSDLDLVFVYDDAGEADPAGAQEAYAAFVRRLITWLTLRTAAGELFDIDTALRPNGSSGLLVSSIEAFERYQRGRGSNTAWTWEHQAITRARWCAGDPTLAARFDAVRHDVLAAPRERGQLVEEIASMRRKVRAAHPVPAAGHGRFDVKHGEGGMIDIEFAVQCLVLLHAGAHPALRANAGNIALLVRAEAAGLLPAGVGRAAADAYRDLRRAQHRARLDEQPTHFEAAPFTPQRAAVQALWGAVFG